MATYRWYSVGVFPHDSTETVKILGWSKSQPRALAVQGTVAAYYASSRKMAARMAKRDRGFDIEWRKF